MARKKLDFEGAISRIEEIVEILENEEISLEKSIALYKEGTELSFACREKLAIAEKQVTMLQKDLEGNITEEAFDVQED